MKKKHLIGIRVDDTIVEFLDKLLISDRDNHGAVVRRLICLFQASPQLLDIFVRFQAGEFGEHHTVPVDTDTARIAENLSAVRNIATTVETLMANLSDTRIGSDLPSTQTHQFDPASPKILRRMHAILEYLNTATALDLSDAPKEKSDAVLQATQNRLRAFYTAPSPATKTSSQPAQVGNSSADAPRAATSSKGS